MSTPTPSLCAAWADFKQTLAQELRIMAILDWMANKLRKMR